MIENYLEILRRHADRDDRKAQYMLGIMHKEKSEFEAARERFHEAAKNDLVEAMYELGLMYLEGIGGKKDYKEARNWFDAAAKEGHTEAEDSLREMDQHWKGCEWERRKPVKSLPKAVRQGHVGAKLLLMENEIKNDSSSNTEPPKLEDIDKIIERNKEYFANILHEIDPNIRLDKEQLRAVVSDNGHSLIIAGAGTGKTTTIAAKVKYLVDKERTLTKDKNDELQKNILVISYTKESVNELKKRINNRLGIRAEIRTFHGFGKSIIDKCVVPKPSVNDSSYEIIFELLEEKLYHDNELLKEALKFMGGYFDVPKEALGYKDLNEYHLCEREKSFEILKTQNKVDEYIQNEKQKLETEKRTLKGERLRSVQEAKVANFLYINGFDYEYEPVYPFPTERKYRPDFLITQGDKKAYLEHWAFSQDGKNTSFTPEEIEKYKKSRDKKISDHDKYDTILLQTWSKYSDGQDLKTHLEKDLREDMVKLGFIFTRRESKDVHDQIWDTSKYKYVSKLMEFLETFISQFKIRDFKSSQFEKWQNENIEPRTRFFLGEIAEYVYNSYCSRMREQNQIDYGDMINDAYTLLNGEHDKLPKLNYKYIIVDEFQDISRHRFNLIKKLSEITKAKVVAVGDDWQSIFAFAGSDYGLFTHFFDEIGAGVELKITNTYRNSQDLIDIVGEFVRRNPAQIQKKLISEKRLSDPIKFVPFDDTCNPYYAMAEAAENAIVEIKKSYKKEDFENLKVLLIGRYNHDLSEICKSGKFRRLERFERSDNHQIQCLKHPDINISFLTVHKSKGLGYDEVIILNMLDGKFGFPSQIEDDSIMKLVQHKDEYPFAEERRLFYVALTRTKNSVYILTPKSRPSCFLDEILKIIQRRPAHSTNSV